jgi:hypothetical protein
VIVDTLEHSKIEEEHGSPWRHARDNEGHSTTQSVQKGGCREPRWHKERSNGDVTSGYVDRGICSGACSGAQSIAMYPSPALQPRTGTFERP